MEVLNNISSFVSMNMSSMPTFPLGVSGFTATKMHQVELAMAAVPTVSLPFTLLALALSFYVISQLNVHFGGPKVPLVGMRSVFETRYTANWNFFRNASSVLNDGYSKVLFPKYSSHKLPC